MELSRLLEFPIEDERTYYAALEEIRRLMGRGLLQPEETHELTWLAERVCDYERRRFKFADIPF